MRAKRRRSPAMAIEVGGPERCRGCGQQLASLRRGIRVVDIAQTKVGWLAWGRVHRASCPTCGQAFAYMIRYIPVECADFTCPRCGPGSALTPDILEITEDETGYNFVALLKCNKCSNRQRLSKLLRPLMRISANREPRGRLHWSKACGAGSVKPSAQPTLVRTQHLPHLLKRPASCDISRWRGVFSLSRRVSPCRAVDRHVALSTDA